MGSAGGAPADTQVMSPTQPSGKDMDMQRRRAKVKEEDGVKATEATRQSGAAQSLQVEGGAAQSLQVVPVTPNGGEVVGNGGSQGSGDAKKEDILALQPYVTPQPPQGPPEEYGP